MWITLIALNWSSSKVGLVTIFFFILEFRFTITSFCMAQRVVVTSIPKSAWRSKRNTSVTWFSFWVVRHSTLCFWRTHLTRKLWSRLIGLHVIFNLSFIGSFYFDTSRISYCASMSINIIKVIHRFMWNRTIYSIYSFFDKPLPFFILDNSPITFKLTKNSVF